MTDPTPIDPVQIQPIQIEPVRTQHYQVDPIATNDPTLAELPVAAAPYSPPTPPAHHTHHGLLPALQSLGYIIVTAIFIITFSVQPFRIPSASMEPTLMVGDFLLVDKQSLGFNDPTFPFPESAIHRGDIIVFHYPVNLSLHLIKRVVGMPGDHLKLRDGHVYINDQIFVEPYAVYRPSSPDSFRDNFPRLQSADPDIDSHWWITMHRLIDHGELIIPADNYFVLGDNRNDSEDSRYWGFVPRSNIVGKPFLIYFSLRPTDNDSDDTGKNVSTDEPRQFNSTQSQQPNPSSSLLPRLNFARWERTFRIVR